MSKIVLADGNAGGAGGGAIVNYGTLNITSSAIVNNKAQDHGGGIYNNGTLLLTNSTVSGNQSHGKGAGQGATNDTIRNTTITGGSSGSNTISTFGGTTLGFNNFGADNDNIAIQGNTITKVQNGIHVLGDAAFLQPVISAGGDDNLTISNNVVGLATAGANNIGASGIFVQKCGRAEYVRQYGA